MRASKDLFGTPSLGGGGGVGADPEKAPARLNLQSRRARVILDGRESATGMYLLDPPVLPCRSAEKGAQAQRG